jgi:hypothetical protein
MSSSMQTQNAMAADQLVTVTAVDDLKRILLARSLFRGMGCLPPVYASVEVRAARADF